jgi:hypothetical protein
VYTKLIALVYSIHYQHQNNNPFGHEKDENLAPFKIMFETKDEHPT